MKVLGWIWEKTLWESLVKKRDDNVHFLIRQIAKGYFGKRRKFPR